MKITKLILWVQENTLAEKFYKKLGFDVVRSQDDHSVVALGGFELELVNMRDDEQFANDAMTGIKAKGLYVFIAVDDADATYQQLVAKGITPATEPKTWPWGRREFVVKDLDGYKLCFGSVVHE